MSAIHSTNRPSVVIVCRASVLIITASLRASARRHTVRPLHRHRLPTCPHRPPARYTTATMTTPSPRGDTVKGGRMRPQEAIRAKEDDCREKNQQRGEECKLERERDMSAAEVCDGSRYEGHAGVDQDSECSEQQVPRHDSAPVEP